MSSYRRHGEVLTVTVGTLLRPEDTSGAAAPSMTTGQSSAAQTEAAGGAGVKLSHR